MPQLGETVAEGKITRWFKSAGDAIAPGDNLFEIETDKVSMEVPAIAAGVLSEIRIPAGEVAPVGAIVAVIAALDGGRVNSATAAAAPLAATKAPIPSSEVLPGAAGLGLARDERPRVQLDPFFEVRTPERNFGPARLPGGTAITPLARRLAAEGGIDLSSLRGSGPHGRIVARDVENAPRSGATAALRSGGPTAEEIKSLFAPGTYEEVPLDGMRRTIAARLTQAFEVPHFYLTADLEIDRLKALREEANAAAPTDRDGRPSYKLSLNDFLVRTLALALRQVPAANAVWAGDRILRLKQADIGVAVALDGGLITPVIRAAETKSVGTISTEMKDLAARAREKRLKPEEYRGGAAAISNLGMHGVREFSAIINPPQAMILAVGAARRQAVEKPDGGVGFASVLTVTLSCDHRVVDGALGAALLAAVKSFVEAPVSMLV